MGMTNELSTERAIEALYTVRAYYASLTAGYPKGKDRRGIGDVMCSEIANSCLMAIKALEQQPCEDCISREAVDNYIVKLMSGYLYDEERARLEDLTAYIWELPSITPQQTRWIPVSERLPKEDGQYLVTIKNLTGYEQLCNDVFECEFFEKDWIFKGWNDNEVVAWMPLPEPYKAESENKE